MPRESESTATVEEMMYTSEFEGLSQYRVPYSRELEGTCLNILFDDSSKLMVSFPSRDTILFSENAGDFVMETCHTMKAEDTVYLIFVDRRNEHPRSGMILVIDMDNHLVTGTFMKQGLTSSYPGLVSREIKFGVIKDGDHPYRKRDIVIQMTWLEKKLNGLIIQILKLCMFIYLLQPTVGR